MKTDRRKIYQKIRITKTVLANEITEHETAVDIATNITNRELRLIASTTKILQICH